MSAKTDKEKAKSKALQAARCDGRTAYAKRALASANGSQFFLCKHCRKYHRCTDSDFIILATACLLFEQEWSTI